MIALEAEELRFGYDRSEPILDGWSAAFKTSEMVAVTAPSGRGKSTLLYLLGLMLRPQRGTVRVFGETATSLPDRARSRLRASRFGFVFQDAVLDPTRTVMDNVLEAALYRPPGNDDLTARAAELLDRFEVNVPHRRRPGQVSGGQAQRIALCRALVSDPSIVLADEPTGNLDAASSDTVISGLRAHVEGSALVVIVTHDSSVIAQCDRVIEL